MHVLDILDGYFLALRYQNVRNFIWTWIGGKDIKTCIAVVTQYALTDVNKITHHNLTILQNSPTFDH
jgi:hypothetical protein